MSFPQPSFCVLQRARSPLVPCRSYFRTTVVAANHNPKKSRNTAVAPKTPKKIIPGNFKFPSVGGPGAARPLPPPPSPAPPPPSNFQMTSIPLSPRPKVMPVRRRTLWETLKAEWVSHRISLCAMLWTFFPSSVDRFQLSSPPSAPMGIISFSWQKTQIKLGRAGRTLDDHIRCLPLSKLG